MKLVKELLTLTDDFCKARGVSEATVSGIIFKNSRVLPRIRAGGDLATRNYEKALSWFRSNWPDRVKWPLKRDAISVTISVNDTMHESVSFQLSHELDELDVPTKTEKGDAK